MTHSVAAGKFGDTANFEASGGDPAFQGQGDYAEDSQAPLASFRSIQRARIPARRSAAKTLK